MNNGKLIEKIKKCLALSKSNNRNEAAVALKQAQVLMKKYNVSYDCLALSEINHARSKACKVQKPPRYLTFLFSLIRYTFGVNSIIEQYTSGCEVVFIGVGTQPEIARYVFEVLHRQLSKDRNDYIKSLKRYKRSNKTRKADLFAEQWVNAAMSSVNKFVQSTKNEELIAAYIDTKWGKTEEYKARARKRKSDDLSAQIAGDRAGKKAQLHIATGQDKRVMLR